MGLWTNEKTHERVTGKEYVSVSSLPSWLGGGTRTNVVVGGRVIQSTYSDGKSYSGEGQRLLPGYRWVPEK